MPTSSIAVLRVNVGLIFESHLSTSYIEGSDVGVSADLIVCLAVNPTCPVAVYLLECIYMSVGLLPR